MAATIVGYFGVRYLVTDVRPVEPVRATEGELALPPPVDRHRHRGHHRTAAAQRLGGVEPDRDRLGQGRRPGRRDRSERQFGRSDVKGNGTAVFTGVGRCPNRIPVSTGPHWHPIPATQAALQRCVDSFHLREVVAYQPASRYWPLQWSEAAIFVALAVALGVGCVWWVRRRLP